MTPSYTVRTTPRFDRLLKALTRRHAELVNDYAEALNIPTSDPYHRTCSMTSRNSKLSGKVKVNTG